MRPSFFVHGLKVFLFFRRRRLGGSKDFDSGDYEMRLRIDEISRNDLDSPVVLVKEVRKKSGAGRSKSFTYEVQVSTTHVYPYETY